MKFEISENADEEETTEAVSPGSSEGYFHPGF